MTDYKATARREDDLWVIEVNGVGVTQAEDITDAWAMAEDLIAAMGRPAGPVWLEAS